MKIGIGIPTPERVHPDFALHSLPQIISNARQIDDVEIFIRHQGGVRTDRNRNIILKDFMDMGGIDQILWLDADMVYPPDIIERYLDLKDLHGEMSVIGCMYFKRTDDHNPIGYIDSDNPERPYRPLMPQLINPGKIYEVTGVGFGGMMVPMKVYEELGEDKWMKYGKNFHNPNASEGNLTHDLEFCKRVKDAGFKIFLHGSVRPGHIGEKLIIQEDFYNNFPPRLIKGIRVAVVMPTIDMDLGKSAASVMKQRAGYDCDIYVVEDEDRVGFTQTFNSVYNSEKDDYDFFVYTAQDAFVGQDWLAHALIEQFKTQAGLVAFNDGKWNGRLASFGLIEKLWAEKNYDGNAFFEGYNSHYADTELTQIAKSENKYSYAEKAVMIEVDYKKAIGEGGGVNKDDKKLYKKRIKKLVDDEELKKEFS